MQPAVSVVVPAFNAWSTLPTVLDALAPQVVDGRREVLVVDSSDVGRDSEVEQRWPWVRFVVLQERTLPGRARNVGTRLAKGELIAFLDADSVPAPDWLDELERGLAREGAGVAGAVLNGTPRNPVGTASYLLEFTDFLPSRRTPLWHAASCNLLLRKSVLTAANGFPEDVWPGEDTLLSYDLCRTGRLTFCPGARVSHLNRTGFVEFLRHQKRLGVSYGHICARLPDYPRRWLGRPSLAPLAAPLRLAALARDLIGHPREAATAICLLPLLALGVVAWASGLSRAGIRSGSSTAGWPRDVERGWI